MNTAADVTIVVTIRDRLSTMSRTLQTLLDTTERIPIVVVLGGCSRDVAQRLRREHPSDRVTFEVVERHYNPAEARNVGLRLAATPLVAIVDSDVVPRPGWLEALLDCRRSTDAAVVVPLILERPTSIHCAGNDLYIDWSDCIALAHKELRYFQKPFHDRANLARCEIDYAELHCQLVEREPHLRLAAFDERIAEGGEVDQALTLRAAGHRIWFEPASVVLFDRFAPVHAIDIPHYVHKWDHAAMLGSLDVIVDKWGIDLSEEGHFLVFLSDTNALVGRIARRFPSEWVLRATSGVAATTTKVARLPMRTLLRRRRRRWGQDRWNSRLDRLKRRTHGPVHPVVAGLRQDPVEQT